MVTAAGSFLVDLVPAKALAFIALLCILSFEIVVEFWAPLLALAISLVLVLLVVGRRIG